MRPSPHPSMSGRPRPLPVRLSSLNKQTRSWRRPRPLPPSAGRSSPMAFQICNFLTCRLQSRRDNGGRGQARDCLGEQTGPRPPLRCSTSYSSHFLLPSQYISPRNATVPFYCHSRGVDSPRTFVLNLHSDEALSREIIGRRCRTARIHMLLASVSPAAPRAICTL